MVAYTCYPSIRGSESGGLPKSRSSRPASHCRETWQNEKRNKTLRCFLSQSSGLRELRQSGKRWEGGVKPEFPRIWLLKCSQAWWLTPVILALIWLRQEETTLAMASLGYLVKSCLRNKHKTTTLKKLSEQQTQPWHFFSGVSFQDGGCFVHCRCPAPQDRLKCLQTL